MEKQIRNNKDIRKCKITKDYILYPEGSVLIEMGNTKVICNATIEEKVPPFKKESKEGWVTAEYSMLPRATQTRTSRDGIKPNSRSIEIKRLIGRALRASIDFEALGERTITIDCDVIQADGGTRTASITGAFVAMSIACYKLYKEKTIEKFPIKNFVAAISVGIVDDEPMVDLCYEEDSVAKVDMNIVMTNKGEYIEVQGTGEQAPFSKNEFNDLLELAEQGIHNLINIQKEVLGEISNEIENNICD